MKNLKYFFLPLVFILSSCYIYKPYVEKEEVINANSKSGGKTLDSSVRSVANPTNVSSSTAAQKKVQINTEDELKIKQDEINRGMQQSNSSTGKENSDGRVNPTTNTSLSGTPSLGRNPDANSSSTKNNNPPSTTTEKKAGLKGKIQPNKYFKISVEGKYYKIQADNWEGDTLVSHILRKPNKVLRFHENQIDEENLLERRFSKSYSDLFTVGAYVAGGAAIILLVL